MMHGKIVKLVRSYGSHWGRIQPFGASREIFFNQKSLQDATAFDRLLEGQVVEFDEESDRANGTHAINVVPVELPVLTRAR